MADERDDADATVEPVVPVRHRWLAGLLGARPGDRVVDLGRGSGASLVQVAPELGGGVAVGVDASPAALHRAADALPFPDAAFDRVLGQNVLELVPDPVRLAAEAGRVLRPGGRLVLGHSDLDTLVFASEDLELTRRLVRAYCDARQPRMDAVDGTIGRRLATIAGRAGLEVLDLQAQVVMDRSFVPGGLGWGYAYHLADTLRDGGAADPGELDRWLAGLGRLDAQGAFLFSLNDCAVICGRIAW